MPISDDNDMLQGLAVVFYRMDFFSEFLSRDDCFGAAVVDPVFDLMFPEHDTRGDRDSTYLDSPKECYLERGDVRETDKKPVSFFKTKCSQDVPKFITENLQIPERVPGGVSSCVFPVESHLVFVLRGNVFIDDVDTDVVFLRDIPFPRLICFFVLELPHVAILLSDTVKWNVR